MWWTRNQIIHNGAQLNILQLLNKIKRLCRKHVSAWHQRWVEKISRWVPPKPRLFKANFDVAMHEDFTVRAAAIRDHLGKIIGTSVHKFQVDDPLEEEVYAALLGVEEAKRRGFTAVTVEGDSLLAIKASSKYQAQVNWRIHGRIGDILQYAADFVSCDFHYVS